MERWSIGLLMIVLAVVPVTVRADPPITVVVFGVPAETMAVTDAPERDARREEPSCPPPITIVRLLDGRRERVRMPLLSCDGAPRDEAVRALSILARPRSRTAPTEEEIREWRDEDGDPALLARDVRLLHPSLLERLQRIGEAFSPHPIEIISGYRPKSPARSRHHHGRALDITVSGVSREALRDFALTLPQTGVGWYPNSVFVHVDVREVSAYWVDLSGPGERPRYVRDAERPTPSAPPPDERAPSREALDRLRRETAEALRNLQVPLPL